MSSSLPVAPGPRLLEQADTAHIEHPWYRLAGARITAQWQLKFSASVLFMGVFFTGYFLLLKYPVFSTTTMPVLAVDRAVGFQPEALWLYVSLWLYVQLPPALLFRRRDVFSYGKCLTGLGLAGFVIFFFWPTILPPGSDEWMQHAAFRSLKEVDASGNACPSLHVAFAVFSAISLEASFRDIRAPRFFHAINLLWCLGILYSTLATRQHVALDVIAGAVLALIAAYLYRRLAPVQPFAADSSENRWARRS